MIIVKTILARNVMAGQGNDDDEKRKKMYLGLYGIFYEANW
jgi:hypothetical protein